MLLIGFALLIDFAAAGAEYNSPKAPAEIQARTRLTHNVPDVRKAKVALKEDHSRAVGACFLKTAVSGDRVDPLLLQVRLARNGTFKRFVTQQSSGRDSVDQCVIDYLSGVSIPNINVGAPLSLTIKFPPPANRLEDPLPLWDAIDSGTLENGLDYYVLNRPGFYPRLNLMIHAGSLAEQDDQRGLAHFVEHMAFRTGYFDKDWVFELDGFDGAKHANGFTTFDLTSLFFDADEHGTLNDAHLQAIKGWISGGIQFDPAEVDIERQVVIEEWRLQQTPKSEAYDPWTRIRDRGTRWSDRHPIGTLESLQAFTPAQAKRFYDAWYRPDRASLVVSGSVTTRSAIADIERVLSTIELPEAPAPEPPPPIDRPGELEYAVMAYPSLNQAVYYAGERTVRPERDHQHMVDLFVETLTLRLLNSRLDTMASLGELPPDTSIDATWRSRYRRTFKIKIFPDLDGDPMPSAAALFRELRRLQLHGFRPDELRVAKRATLDGWAGIETDAHDISYQSIKNELGRHLHYGEPMPGPAYEAAMAADFVPSITMAQVNAMFKDMWLSGPREAGVATRGWERDAPELDEVRAALDPIWSEAPEPRTKLLDIDAVKDPTMGGLPPTNAPITDRWSVPETTWDGFKTPSGVAIHVVPGRFHGRRAAIHILGPGIGDSDDERVDAFVARVLHRGSETAGLSPQEMRTWGMLRGASFQVRLGHRYSWIEVKGHWRDFESLLAISRSLALDSPSADRAGMQDLVRTKLSQEDENIHALLDNAIRQSRAMGPRLPDDADDRVDVDRANRTRRSLFADPSKVTVLVSGQVPKRLPRERMLMRAFSDWGPAEPTPKYSPWTPPTPQQRFTLEVMPEGKAAMRSVYRGALGNDAARSRHELPVLAQMLRSHLLKTLRVRGGLVYTIKVGSALHPSDPPTYALTIDFECDSARVKEAREALAKAMTTFSASITPEAADIAVSTRRRAADDQNVWFGGAIRALVSGEELVAPIANVRDVRALQMDADSLRKAAKTLLDPKRHTLVIAVPPGGAPDKSR